MLCDENDIMENIGNKVFEQKPELKQYGKFFIYIGGSFDGNKTLKQNNVKNQDKFVIYNEENIMKERERRKLNDIAEFLEKEKKIDVIISAEDTIDLILIKLVIDKSTKCIILCKENDIFNVIINKIYEKYPTYNKIGNYFISNNSLVNEYKSLKENNIKKGDFVILVEFRGNTVNFVASFTDRNLKQEMDKLKYLAQELKEEKKIDVIISATSTKNLLTLKFQSVDQNLECYILCNENDIFNSIANKVFEENPEFKEYGNYFLCNGTNINEYKSLKENLIKDKSIIIINKMEDEDLNDIHDNSKIEERRLKKLAEKIKKETNIDVIIFAEDTKNIITIRLKSRNEKINYYIICSIYDMFNRILNKVFKLNPEFKDYNNEYVCNGSFVNIYKSLKENKIKCDNLIIINDKKKERIIQPFHYDEYDIEKEELKKMADKLKEETKSDVIISAKSTKNLLILKFQSIDQTVNCYVLCNKNDIFNSVANKVFEQNKEFKELGNNFLCKGNAINVYKSLFENNIEDRDVIILYNSNDDE